MATRPRASQKLVFEDQASSGYELVRFFVYHYKNVVCVLGGFHELESLKPGLFPDIRGLCQVGQNG